MSARVDLRQLVDREPVGGADGPGVTGWLQRLCRVLSRRVRASEVGLSLVSEGRLLTAAASSARGAELEDLQVSLGEGPCLLAYSSRAPVLVPDLAEMADGVWPGYARRAIEHGVLAVFAFPLQVGSVRLGAVDVYRGAPGALSGAETSTALLGAELALETLLDAGSSPGGVAALVDDAQGVPLEVYQAQGMVMVQLGVDAAEALARLRARAFSEDRRLVDVARDVIGRRVTWQDDP